MPTSRLKPVIWAANWVRTFRFFLQTPWNFHVADWKSERSEIMYVRYSDCVIVTVHLFFPHCRPFLIVDLLTYPLENWVFKFVKRCSFTKILKNSVNAFYRSRLWCAEWFSTSAGWNCRWFATDLNLDSRKTSQEQYSVLEPLFRQRPWDLFRSLLLLLKLQNVAWNSLCAVCELPNRGWRCLEKTRCLLPLFV